MKIACFAFEVVREIPGHVDPPPTAVSSTVSTGPVSPPAQRDPLPLLLYVIAAVVALIAIFGPPSLNSYLKRDGPPPRSG